MTGSTSVTLFPVDNCENECEQFEFQLNQGDVCKYQFSNVLAVQKKIEHFPQFCLGRVKGFSTIIIMSVREMIFVSHLNIWE